MRRRFKPAKLQRLDDILQKLLKNHQLPLKLEDRRLRDVWSKAVGPRVAAQTRPDSIRRDVLYIKVANSAWMQQLHFMKQEILEKFTRLHPQEPIRDIFFSIGEISAPAASPENRPFSGITPALKARDKKMIESSLSTVADQELREILKRTMTKEITRRRRMEKQQDR